MSLFTGLFRRTPDQIAQDHEQPVAVSYTALRARHASVLDRAGAQGLDPNTLLILLQFFGPLLVALVERLLKRLESR